MLFSYNLANLPSKVEGVGYNAGLTYSYGYLSDGTKTSADCGAGSTAQGLRYRGSFVYEILEGELERLQSISWPEGRIVLEYDGNDTEPCLVSYDWLVTDHVGSVRAIAGMRTGSTGVKEVNGYLPFGTRLPGTLQSSGNRHRFGGKEEQRIGSTDLKLLDFGARYYDAFACRWTALDPMAWKYPAITPYSYCAGDPVNLVDVDGRDGMLIGFGTKQDPYIVVATYYYQTNSLNKEQIDGLKAAMADYNQSLLKVKDKEGRDVFVSFNLTLQETDNPQEERLKDFFTDLDGNPHYFGNIVTTEMNNNDRYGYATCLEIGFSISKIQSGIDEGMNAKSLYKGVAIHEIGHNLGGDHSDKTTVMQSVNTVIYNSMDPNQNKTLFSYPTFSKAFVKKIFNRRDSRNSTSIGVIWTKKL